MSFRLEWLCASLIVATGLLVADPVTADDEDVGRMLRLLETGSVEEQIDAVRWLGLNLVEEARQPLLRLMTQPPQDEDQEDLMRVARMMYDLLRKPELLRFKNKEEVLDHLDDPDSRTRADAVRHGAYFDLREEAGRVGERLDDPDPFVREEALITLRLLRDESHRKRALELLRDTEGAVRLRALEYLHGFGDPRLMDPMAQIVADANRWISQPATRVLSGGDQAGAAVRVILEQAAAEDDKDRTVRYLAALTRFDAPSEWPSESRDRLRPFLTNDAEAVRTEAALLVADFDPEAARRTLLHSLSSDVTANRLAAVRGLATMEVRVDVDVVSGMLADADPEVRRAAVSLATHLPPRHRRRVCLEVLRRPDESVEVVSLVLTHLPEVGAADDAKFLLQYAQQAEPDFLRMNAVNALAGLERRTGSRLGHDWYRLVLGDPNQGRSVKRAVLGAVESDGDGTFLPLLADELRACPAHDADYAKALSSAISALVGRRLHGDGFGAEATQ